MRNFIFIIFIAASSLIACKTTTHAMGADKIEPSNSGKKIEKEVVQDDITYDLIISFISKGAGIDNEMKNKIDAVLISFNKKNKTNIKPEITHWGREGEVDYNFSGKNLSTNQKNAFIARIKETIGTSDMVHLVYNKKSRHKR